MILYHLSSGSGGMADALDSGSSGSNPVRVQVPFSAWKNLEDLFFKVSDCRQSAPRNYVSRSLFLSL